MNPYYDRNGITIYLGDCLKVMPWLVGMGVVVDAVIADPPYGITACNWDTVIPFEPMWANYKMLIKKTGAVVLFGSEPFSSLLRVSNLEWYKYDWVWRKNRAANFFNAKNKPLSVTENILCFSAGTTANCSGNKMPYYPQGVQISGELYKRPNRNTSNHRFDRPSHRATDRGYIIQGKNYPINLIKINQEINKVVHPTQKPVALLQYLIRTYTNPNDLILDNTMGSGTTLVAAQNEGRRCVGIELEEEYCKVAVDRLKQLSFFNIPDKPKEKLIQSTKIPLPGIL